MDELAQNHSPTRPLDLLRIRVCFLFLFPLLALQLFSSFVLAQVGSGPHELPTKAATHPSDPDWAIAPFVLNVDLTRSPLQRQNLSLLVRTKCEYNSGWLYAKRRYCGSRTRLMRLNQNHQLIFRGAKFFEIDSEKDPFRYSMEIEFYAQSAKDEGDLAWSPQILRVVLPSPKAFRELREKQEQGVALTIRQLPPQDLKLVFDGQDFLRSSLVQLPEAEVAVEISPSPIQRPTTHIQVESILNWQLWIWTNRDLYWPRDPRLGQLSRLRLPPTYLGGFSPLIPDSFDLQVSFRSSPFDGNATRLRSARKSARLPSEQIGRAHV